MAGIWSGRIAAASRNSADAAPVADHDQRVSHVRVARCARGYVGPISAVIPAPLTYATCLFPRTDPGPDWRALLVNGPASRRAAFCIAIEGRRWLVTLASLFDEPSPRDHESFQALARSLPVRDLHHAIGDLEPLSAVIQHRFPGSRRRRYERLRDLPAGMIAMGDAVCSFNPVYGQGMTVAALQSEALDLALTEAARRGQLDRRFVRRWYRQIAAIIDVAWQGVELEDRRYPELARQRPIGLRALQWYMTRVQVATLMNADVTRQFYRVIGLLDAPTSLFRPRTVVRVLKSGGGL